MHGIIHDLTIRIHAFYSDMTWLYRHYIGVRCHHPSPDVAVHLDSDPRGTRLVVPRVHPDHFSQAINVEGVVTLDTAQCVDRGQGVMAQGSLGEWGKVLDFRGKGNDF